MDDKIVGWLQRIKRCSLKEILKKIFIFIDLFIVFTSLFTGAAYLGYKLSRIRILYYIYNSAFTLSIYMLGTLLNKAKIFGIVVNIILLLFSVILSILFLTKLVNII